jgi:3-phenylpropionate/cinnamic acid dioxygenase small subunit
MTTLRDHRWGRNESNDPSRWAVDHPKPAAGPFVRVRAMADARGEIENLLYRYAEAIDGGDFDAVGALFAAGRVCGPDGTPIAEGAEAVAALYTSTTRRYPDDGTPKTRHMITNPLVEVEGDTATARSRFTVYQATEALPLQPIIAGDYHDRFHRVDGRWAFAERVMRPALFGDLSQHLLISRRRAGDTAT